MNRSLRLKIALLTTLVALGVMAAMSISGAYFFGREYGRALESRSLAVAKSLKIQLDRVLQYGLRLESLVGFEEQLAEAVKEYPGVVEAMVVAPDGRILFHNDPRLMQSGVADPALVRAVGSPREAIVHGTAAGEGRISAVVPVSGPSGDHGGIVVVAFPESIVSDNVRKLWLLEAGVGLVFLAAGVLLLLAVVSAYVTRPMARLIASVQRMEGRPLVEAQAAPVETRDELGALAESFNRMLGGLKSTTVSKQELERRNHDISLLSEMNQVLLSALTLEEAYALLPRFAERLFPGGEGTLYVFGRIPSVLEAKVSWGGAAPSPGMAAHDCWALRRAHMHVVADARADFLCPHAEGDARAQVCLPLSSQGEVIGLLHAVLAVAPGENEQRLAGMLAEQLSFALGNLRLREALREHSMRDALTGLHNRRYLEETLARELARVRRSGLPLAVVMVDVDHFKRINDGFGHDAGDAVLRGLGAILQASVRGSDIACRYGGEEFLLVLPEASLATAAQRAEEVRAAVSRMELAHGGRPLGQLSVSAGVAVCPQHAADAAALVSAADEALYRAKREGRNRVVTAVAPAAAPGRVAA